MADPFYVNRGEIKHNLSRLKASVQRLQSQSQFPTSPTFKESQSGDVVFDKALVEEILGIISELEHQLKDLTDTFAIQSTKAKQLGLSAQEMANRKEIVENHQKEFDDLKDNFAYQVKGDPSASTATVISGFYGKRETSQRRYQVDKENHGYAGSFSSDKRDSFPPAVEPNRVSMHAMKDIRNFADEDDDEDLVEIYQRKAKDVEMGTVKVQNRRGRGPVGEFLERHFPLTTRRNQIIFYSFPIVLVLVILIIVLAVNFS